MSIHHDCNCDRCRHCEDVEIVWNQEWKAYGMLTKDGRWVSGMGIASGYSVTPNDTALFHFGHCILTHQTKAPGCWPQTDRIEAGTGSILKGTWNTARVFYANVMNESLA